MKKNKHFFFVVARASVSDGTGIAWLRCAVLPRNDENDDIYHESLVSLID